ncbi:SWIM zinc finger domain-containing protein [Stigmatella sp. ncwal1]|uniref:SWIM zinc finger domain-containing protein n=1 Tax=Stigmatella ashevillensis TaxID=2995309 RepID=A0ABT5DMH8_9BACT|nr:SWIM zinc finger family protein [Stigmatella ashevillena]MDC0714862.1 SWIM zinc finger domain-containing protein [Stigmatella ashevillena]
MAISLTSEQALALAPDTSVASAGQKLATGQSWQGLGRNERAAWGECKGSALYQVRVDLADLSSKCSCPSRKFPCKHAVGLLLLAAAERLPAGVPPAWVEEWLSRRTAASERKAKREAPGTQAPAPVDPEAQSRRAADRHERVRQGVEALSLWMEDLVRQGFAGLEAETAAWNTQAARLVDAQAPGLAAQVRQLAVLPGSSPHWPRTMLERLGRLALATEGWRKLEQLPPLLAADLRALVGIPLREEDVIARGERLTDRWVVIAQEVEDSERVRTQRTYLLGTTQGRTALLLQFAAGPGAHFTERFLPGTAFDAELVFWPSAAPQRAKLLERQGEVHPWTGALPSLTPEGLCQRFAQELSQQPFHEQTAALLGQVIPVLDAEGRVWLQDAAGKALRAGACDTWRLLALSGGHPLDVFVEWDGEETRPLSARVQERLYALGGTLQ